MANPEGFRRPDNSGLMSRQNKNGTLPAEAQELGGRLSTPVLKRRRISSKTAMKARNFLRHDPVTHAWEKLPARA